MNTNTSILKSATATGAGALATNKVLRNTYMLLSATLLFSALTAGISMVFNLPHPGLIITLVGYFGLLFLTNYLSNSAWGIASVFALTGFMGYTLGPIISAYLTMFSNGSELVMMAMGGTGVIFLGLSGYALTTRKDFSFMGGFLMVGLFVVLAAALLNIFLEIPLLFLVINAAIIMIMSGFILFETSQVVNGGETNYILATVTLYVSVFNLFTSLLHILGVMNDE